MKLIRTEISSRDNKKHAFIKYYFSVTAILFLIICLLGFGTGISLKSSNGINIKSFRFILHGFIGFLWVILYVLQTQLAFRNNIRLHMKLGKVSFFVIILLALSVLYLLFSTKNTYPEIPNEELALFSGGMLFNALGGSIFLLLLGVAKRKKSFIHKRLMFFGTLLLIGTAIDRLPWIFHGFDDGNLGLVLLSTVLFALPLIIFDLITAKSKLKVFSLLVLLYSILIGFLSFMLLMPYVFTSETWIEFVEFLSSLL